MKTLTRILRRGAFWLQASRHQSDIAAELEHHRARTQAALEADGIPAAEAAARSRRAMGNVTLAREEARDVWTAVSLERAWRDAVYGARALRREPAFALTALLTLTLGIATATTVFSVVDAEVWKPLPFPSPERLVAVDARSPATHNNSEQISPSDYLAWQSESRLVDYAAQTFGPRRVLRRAGAESVSVRLVTANYFRVLARVPRLGRGFGPEDAHARAAILADRAWRRLFNADPSVVGRSMTLDGAEFAIVGVTADEYLEFDPEPDLFVVLDPAAAQPRERLMRSMDVIGRLHDGATRGEAQAELQTITARISAEVPDDHAGHHVGLRDLREANTSYNWRPLYFFLGAAWLVLLLSCVNVANLLLARALRRQREFAIRGALGGGRGALVRQLVVEGALLAVPGAGAAALLSAWALRAFVTQIPGGFLLRGAHFSVDARIAGFVMLLAGVTTILLSLAPLFLARRVELNLMLGQGGRTAGRSPRQVRMRNGLLVAQMTMTLVLLVGAGLFGASYWRLAHMPLGFDSRDRIAARVVLSGPRYAADAPARDFAERLIERARAIPGVRQAAVGSSTPMASGRSVRFVAADRDRPRVGDEPSAIVRAISPDYFETFGIPMVAGRAFTAADADGAPRVAIVNERLARRLFPGQTAVGRRLELIPGAGAGWTRRPGSMLIVGVVANAKEVGLNEVDFNGLYWPFAQAPASELELAVSTTIPAAGVTDAVRAAVAATDPDLPVTRLTTLTQRVRDATRGDRFNLTLIGSFALLAIVLALVGVYGAMACAVQERTREFGVRLALGAQPGAIVRSTLWAAARFGLLGSAAGVALVIVLARLVGSALFMVAGEHEGLLYGVSLTDPLTMAAATLASVVIATVSGLVPARQATRVDPLVALRSE